ncbi:DUF2905 domain-containing protein [Acidihalobacter prosperus]|uniref:DUF2905 domain-containing protein n=1 Tax=Acidihalobacter prosperus TaxID=160660 RepID=A0A1A6C1H5_9GAMM|nr:DUF2905 domain-containing protein [Acidihalobacter prosperus]OBS08399.1 hypothetical protein Thpro_022649 [Acidihalobacter prosperus]
MAKALIALGAVLIVAGLAWPWLARLGLGRLPGDFVFRREGFVFYFPLTTSIVVSLVISLLIWLFRK